MSILNCITVQIKIYIHCIHKKNATKTISFEKFKMYDKNSIFDKLYNVYSDKSNMALEHYNS